MVKAWGQDYIGSVTDHGFRPGKFPADYMQPVVREDRMLSVETEHFDDDSAEHSVVQVSVLVSVQHLVMVDHMVFWLGPCERTMTLAPAARKRLEREALSSWAQL